MTDPRYIRSLLIDVTKELATIPDTSKRQAMLDARDLCAHVLGCSPAHILAGLVDYPTPEQYARIQELIKRMKDEHVPFPYLVGEQPFCDLTLTMRAPVLIPRPETESWLVESWKQIGEKKVTRILDLCTGSGCIALACARRWPDAQVIGIDIAEHAVKLAQENAERNGITNVTFMQGDLFKPLLEQGVTEPFDLIFANPPYIDELNKERVALSVRLHEDPQALFAAKHGMAVSSRIILHARRFLAPEGQLWMECDHGQGAPLMRFMEETGYMDLGCFKDQYGVQRIITARSPMIAQL
jgi:release factor glutamine methyltransferase